ncbi:MAG: DNA/RNA non-specific endonuclease [Bacteroidales bacterium]|nr:DNA/RNA non-specific endonuclease [Bacteroidales bacterium]
MTTGETSGLSSTGVTLSGSFEGATGTISEVGFRYGTTSGSLGTKAVATGTSSPFSKALTGLTPNTTYYYKAYVIEGGEERLSSQSSFKTKAIATADVTTSAADNLTQTSATLYGSYTDATGTVSRVGFKYGISSGNLTQDVYTDGNSSSFSENITGLIEGKKYYYKAYVVEYNEETGTEYRYGDEMSFTTVSYPNYLGRYEVPAITNLSGSGSTGTNAAKGDRWRRYNTTNANRQIATHSFEHPDSHTWVCNYTILYDQTRYAPLWTAHAMHQSMWPNKKVGRNESWSTDPAIGLTQQSGLDNAGTVGYSRGHLVASNYRQSTVEQNKQTFYYSNQAPQWQDSFNSGVWSSLEEAVASNAPSGSDTLYVVTGVLYEGSITTLKSGSLNVPIPSHFYKCLMLCSFNAQGEMTAASGCAYIFTNEAHNGSYSSGITTINSIETRSGFDFFANVPTSLQNAAENMTDSLW